MEYLLFTSKELEMVLSELEKAKPAFKRYRYVEVLAEFERGIVGRYGDFVILLADTALNLKTEPLARILVELSEDDGSYKPFRFGKYRYDEKLIIDAEFTEELFHDYLPALLSEMVKARILIRDSNIRAKHLAEVETEMVHKVTKLTEDAKTASPEKLERLSFEVSEMRAEFFSSYMHFKNDLEEIFSAIYMAEKISNFLGGMLNEELEIMKLELERVKYYESSFEQTLSGVRDSLDVVHLRLEMLRGKENLELRKRTSALQAAAAIIEFVAVYYYTLKIWETFLPIEEMPSILSFSLLFAFATTVVILTDALGEYIKDRKVTAKFVLLSAILLLILVLMVYTPILYSEV